MRNLRALTLDYVPVNDTALESLKALPSLEQLSLDSTNVTDRGAETLGSMSTLRVLDLYHTPISKRAHAALQAALPQCRIIYDDQSASPNRRVAHEQ